MEWATFSPAGQNARRLQGNQFYSMNRNRTNLAMTLSSGEILSCYLSPLPDNPSGRHQRADHICDLWLEISAFMEVSTTHNS